MELLVPSPATLKKYGLDLSTWEEIARHQNYVCAVCHRLPKSGRLNIDHFHIVKWSKMPPDQRKLYVRGLCCYQCNHAALRRGMTPDRLRSAAHYLESFALPATSS